MKQIIVTDPLLTLLQDHKHANTELKTYDKLEKSIKTEIIKNYLKEECADIITPEGIIIARYFQASPREMINSAKLKVERPDIYEAYKTKLIFNQFQGLR